MAINSAAEIPFPLMSPTASTIRSVPERNEVVVVSTDRARRDADPMNFKRGQVRHFAREEQLLHLVGDAELVLQPLLLFLLVDQFGQRSGHGVERPFERRHLVMAVDLDAVA